MVSFQGVLTQPHDQHGVLSMEAYKSNCVYGPTWVSMFAIKLIIA